MSMAKNFLSLAQPFDWMLSRNQSTNGCDIMPFLQLTHTPGYGHLRPRQLDCGRERWRQCEVNVRGGFSQKLNLALGNICQWERPTDSTIPNPQLPRNHLQFQSSSALAWACSHPTGIYSSICPVLASRCIGVDKMTFTS